MKNTDNRTINNILLYKNIKLNMEVKDNKGNTGIVINIYDIHNVEVEYLHGGIGFYCLYKFCGKYDPLYIENYG